jgi:glutathione S-transferase
MKFITHSMCPFAQKAWIGLELTQTIPYELREIPLYGPHGKPAWFRQLNPRGTVPTLVIDDTVVFTDSDDILNHLFGQKGSSTTTHDDDDESTRMQMREFRYELINGKLLPAGKRAVLGEGEPATGELRAVLREINEHRVICDWLDQQQHHHPDQHPQQLQLSVAHCHAFPFLWRLDQEGLIRHPDDDGASSPSSSEHQYGNIIQWLRLCERHPAVAKTIPRQGWWWWW